MNINNCFVKMHGGIKCMSVFSSESAEGFDKNHRKNKKAKRKNCKTMWDEMKRFWRPKIPVFGMNCGEHGFAVINMPKSLASVLCDKCQQVSWIYIEFQDLTVCSEYWVKQDQNAPYDKYNNGYVVMECFEEEFSRLIANDCLTVVGKMFKCSISLSMLKETGRIICLNAIAILENGLLYDNEESLFEWAIYRVGYRSAMTRRRLYRGLIEK